MLTIEEIKEKLNKIFDIVYCGELCFKDRAELFCHMLSTELAFACVEEKMDIEEIHELLSAVKSNTLTKIDDIKKHLKEDL